MDNKKIAIGILGLLTILNIVLVDVAEARTLTVGSTGADVIELQTYLIENGYPIPFIELGIAKKGYFGEQTKNAVQMYQEERGLSLTGSIDSSGYKGSGLSFGAVPGYDFSSPYFSVGRNRFWSYQQDVAASASTSCSFGPIVATSTLLRVSVHYTKLSTSTEAEIGIGRNPTATTTSLGAGDFVTGGGLLYASTTPQSIYQLLPGDYINIKQGNGSTAGTVPHAGKCQALWIETAL